MARRAFGTSVTPNADTLVEVQAAVTGRTYYITKITFAKAAHVNSKYVQVQDTAGTPVVICRFNDLTVAAGVPDVITADYGEKGVACTASKGIDVVGEGSGHTAGKVYVEGYYIV